MWRLVPNKTFVEERDAKRAARAAAAASRKRTHKTKAGSKSGTLSSPTPAPASPFKTEAAASLSASTFSSSFSFPVWFFACVRGPDPLRLGVNTPLADRSFQSLSRDPAPRDQTFKPRNYLSTDALTKRQGKPTASFAPSAAKQPERPPLNVIVGDTNGGTITSRLMERIGPSSSSSSPLQSVRVSVALETASSEGDGGVDALLSPLDHEDDPMEALATAHGLVVLAPMATVTSEAETILEGLATLRTSVTGEIAPPVVLVLTFDTSASQPCIFRGPSAGPVAKLVANAGADLCSVIACDLNPDSGAAAALEAMGEAVVLLQAARKAAQQVAAAAAAAAVVAAPTDSQPEDHDLDGTYNPQGKASLVRLVLVGPSGIGKTGLISSFVHGYDVVSSAPTSATSSLRKAGTVTLVAGSIDIELIDTSGSQSDAAATGRALAYAEADCVVICVPAGGPGGGGAIMLGQVIDDFEDELDEHAADVPRVILWIDGSPVLGLPPPPLPTAMGASRAVSARLGDAPGIARTLVGLVDHLVANTTDSPQELVLTRVMGAAAARRAQPVSSVADALGSKAGAVVLDRHAFLGTAGSLSLGLVAAGNGGVSIAVGIHPPGGGREFAYACEWADVDQGKVCSRRSSDLVLICFIEILWILVLHRGS